MAEFFATGRAIDLILAVVALEALGLFVFHRTTGRGLPITDVIGQLSAGVFLLLAVRCALTNAPWTLTALFLVASLPAHAGDIARRWRRACSPAESSKS